MMSSKNLTLLITLIMIISLGGFYFYSQTLSSRSDELEANTPQTQEQEEESAENTDQDSLANSRYIDYSQEAYVQNSGKRRVLFFHANWCPTCRAANLDLFNNLEVIPNDVVILKTDYDTETELKSTYGITYQHTFVQVDAEGNEVTKWSGGGTDQLLTKLK